MGWLLGRARRGGVPVVWPSLCECVGRRGPLPIQQRAGDGEEGGAGRHVWFQEVRLCARVAGVSAVAAPGGS